MASKNKSVKRHESILSALNCQKVHVNDLWSLWYCIGITIFSVYLISVSIQRFAVYIVFPWPDNSQPYFELNAYVGFVGAAIVLMPFFIVAALICIGNLANDGYHLGSQSDGQLLICDSKHPLGFIRTVWLHCGPTASLLHMLSAFCLLIPRVLMQAQLAVHGFTPKDNMWRTDLDFLIDHKERTMALTLVSSNNATNPGSSVADSKNANLPEEVHRLDGNTLISPEFLNYALALIVYAIRYPVVFWTTNKTLSCLFSFQLMQNGIQSLLSFTGFTLLYKLQSFECENILPSSEQCLLSPLFSALLHVIYTVIVIASGSLVYVYIYQKYKIYMMNERRKQRIVWKNDSILWGYLSHCAALILLVLLAVLSGPIIYDYMVVYRSTLDGIILACVISTIMHLFCWIVLWLFLTLKNNWKFHYDSLETQQLLHNLAKAYASHGSDQPLLVINEGLSYVVHDPSQKLTITNVLDRLNLNESHAAPADDEEEIYWLKPKSLERKETNDSKNQPSWFGRRRSSPSPSKHKVMFDSSVVSLNSSKYKASSKSPKINKFKRQNIKFEDLTDSDDDGDYATLRDLPLVQEENEDEAIDVSENDFYKKKKSAFNELDENEEGACDSLLSELDKASITRMGSIQSTQGFHKEKSNGISLPTPLSGSSSPSPPGKYSETSSGIHSSSSISENPSRRSSSVDEMHEVGLGNRQQGNWRSMSLQRTNYPSNYFASRNQRYDTYIPQENGSCSDHETASAALIHKQNQPQNFVEELNSRSQYIQNPHTHVKSLNHQRSDQRKTHHKNSHYGSSTDFSSKPNLSSRHYRDMAKHSGKSESNLTYS